MNRVPSHFDEIIRKSCMKAGSINMNSTSMDFKSMNLAEIQKDKQAKANQKISRNSNMFKNMSKIKYVGKSQKIQKNIDKALNLVGQAQEENKKTERLIHEGFNVNKIKIA